MIEFRMPALGADMERGTVLEWKVAPGDTVHRGDIVAVVDTEKSDIDIEVFRDGVVRELVVPVGAEVPVGAVLALFDEPGAAPVARPAPAPVAPPVAEPAPIPEVAAPVAAAAPPAPAPPPLPPPADGRVLSPLVRRLAAERHVDLHRVHPTGPAGTICRHDVEVAVGPEHRPRVSPLARRLAAAGGVDVTALHGTGPGGAVVARDVGTAPEAVPVEAPPVPPTGARIPARRAGGAGRAASMRQATAELMVRSVREIPHYYLRHDVDLSGALAWLAARNEACSVADRIVPAVLLLKATARAAIDVPDLNGHWVDGDFRPADHVDLGLAVSMRTGGVIAPTIAGADGLGLDDLMAAVRAVVGRARAGKLRSSDVAPATITVTDLGDQGVDEVLGVIYPPQVALVGFGRVRERPWTIDGLIGVRPIVTVTLAADHRASEGHRGSAFLAAIERHLHHPEDL